MKADKKTETEVMGTITRFLEGYSRRDIEATLSLLAPDPDLTIIGTGADEKLVGIEKARSQIKRDYEQAEAISIKLGTTSISAAGPVAWVSADSAWTVKAGGKQRKYDWRWTMVLEKRGGKWLIAQSHLSAPAAGQAVGDSFPDK